MSTTADALKGIKDGQLDVMTERFCFWKDDQPGWFLPVAVTTDQECGEPDFQGSFCVQIFLFFCELCCVDFIRIPNGNDGVGGGACTASKAAIT